MSAFNSTLAGATAMTSLIVAMLFTRFWRQSHDSFFLLFAVAFAIDAAMRFVLGFSTAGEDQPLYYVPRVVTFGLIIVAIVHKNWPRSG